MLRSIPADFQARLCAVSWIFRCVQQEFTRADLAFFGLLFRRHICKRSQLDRRKARLGYRQCEQPELQGVLYHWVG
jgi:hypothetical protein